MRKPLTVIIAEHNEGPQVNDTIDNMLATSDSSLYNIVVISDGSKENLPDLSGYGDGVIHRVSPKRHGVGASFDQGAGIADSDHLVIMGSDIRFRDNNYMEKMLNHLEDDKNENSFISGASLGINLKRMDVNADHLMCRQGADMLFFLKAEDLPQKGAVMSQLRTNHHVATFRNIFEAKWLDWKHGGIYEIPCILGAFYGVRKVWYDYIGGFSGHRRWGTLEPFISVKSWLAGGECKCAADVQTAHIFKSGGQCSHQTHPHDIIYNKLMMARVIFPDIEKKFINFLGNNATIELAKTIFSENEANLDMLSYNFQMVRKRDIHWFYEKFPFKYYDQILSKDKKS